MCGIAGYAAAEGVLSGDGAVRTMMDAMARRGPDSEGSWRWPGAVFGHRRLAIIDLSEAGHQPMISDDGQIGVVFNGCIYNFMELRSELENRGCRFRSRCDTEVLLHGYREWGIDALARRLRGMFAFAVWDEGRRTLTLVRDHLGVKPLIYSQRGDRFGFASTVGALRAAGFGGDINPDAVLDVLEYGWVNDERSIYEGIHKLAPAEILEWTGGSITRRQYWSLPEGVNSHIRFGEAVERTEELLLEAVRLRLNADVPVGALLSGGIDSALVCWAMREWNADITAFTVRAPGDPSDESPAAAHTARTLGVRHQIVELPEAQPSLDALTDAYSEPFASSSAFALLLVSEAVKRRATVLLTGDGGDDVFLGYPFFRHAWAAERVARRLPDFASPLWRGIRGVVPDIGPARRLRNFMDYATGGLGEYARAHDGLPYLEQRSILGEQLAGRQLPQRRMAASETPARHFLIDVFHHHRRLHFTSEFMQKVDGGTMHYALEARAPFLDHVLWEFAATLPPEVRLRRGVLKAVLREIALRRIGPEVAFRKKQGFTAPVERWLAGRWSGLLEQLREHPLVEREGWVRPGSLAGPLDQATKENHAPVQLWRLLMLNRWLEKNGARVPSSGADFPAFVSPA